MDINKYYTDSLNVLTIEANKLVGKVMKNENMDNDEIIGYIKGVRALQFELSIMLELECLKNMESTKKDGCYGYDIINKENGAIIGDDGKFYYIDEESAMKGAEEYLRNFIIPIEFHNLKSFSDFRIVIKDRGC